MDLNETNDLIAAISQSVTMSDMAEYWKDFLSMCDALLLYIHANHCTNAFQELIDSQWAMLPWLKFMIITSTLAGYFSFGQS